MRTDARTRPAPVRPPVQSTTGQLTVSHYRELNRLRIGWKTTAGVVIGEARDETALLVGALGAEGAAALDLFDRAQLACVIHVCRGSKTLSETGQRLFAVTRGKRKVANDADRLRKYLARFGLTWPCSIYSLTYVVYHTRNRWIDTPQKTRLMRCQHETKKRPDFTSAAYLNAGVV